MVLQQGEHGGVPRRIEVVLLERGTVVQEELLASKHGSSTGAASVFQVSLQSESAGHRGPSLALEQSAIRIAEAHIRRQHLKLSSEQPRGSTCVGGCHSLPEIDAHHTLDVLTLGE